MKILTIPLLVLLIASCAQLHSIQVMSIDQSQGSLTPFTIEINELGFDAAEAVEIAKHASKEKLAEQLEGVQTLIELANMGPRTGKPVYDIHYADGIAQKVYAACSGKKITGLISIRESLSGGPLSGEIVKIKGFCIETTGATNEVTE